MEMQYQIKGIDGKWRGCNFQAVMWMLKTRNTARLPLLEYRPVKNQVTNS